VNFYFFSEFLNVEFVISPALYSHPALHLLNFLFITTLLCSQMILYGFTLSFLDGKELRFSYFLGIFFSIYIFSFSFRPFIHCLFNYLLYCQVPGFLLKVCCGLVTGQLFFLSSWLLSHCKNGVPFRPKEFSQNSIKLWIFLARHVHRASEEGSGNGLGFKLVKKLFDT